MVRKRLQIKEASSAHILVDAAPEQYAEIEGNGYVAPEAVDKAHLRISEQVYRCPYKGRCLYVDFDDGAHRVSRVAWIYDDVLLG